MTSTNKLQMAELSEDLQIRDSFFDSHVSIDNWELENSSKFNTFINESFISNLNEQILSVDESEDNEEQQIRIWDNKNNRFNIIRPFNHQLFVKNYLEDPQKIEVQNTIFAYFSI